MRSTYLSLAAVTAGTASAAALPDYDETSLLHGFSKRDWIGDQNGNLRITFSDEKTNIGDVDINDIFAGIGDKCDGFGGSCVETPFTFDGLRVPDGTGTVDGITVSVIADGKYQTWVRNGLIDALKIAVDGAAECKDITHQPTCPNLMTYCPAEPGNHHVCTVPVYWSITYQPPEGGNSGVNYVDTNLSVTVDEGGFCERLFEVGGAVAGSINGYASGIFTLAGIGCRD